MEMLAANRGVYNRRLPHNIDAEVAVLGSIFVFGRKAYDKVSPVLQTEHFILVEHQKIYAHCVELIEAGHAADPVTLRSFFTNSDDSTQITPKYLLHLADSSVTPSVAESYARGIKADACRRQLIGIADELSTHAYNGHDVSEAISLAGIGISNIDVDYGYTRGSYIYEDAEDLNLGAIPPRGWLLGTMLCRQYVTVMASAGGVGKSSVAIAWALSLATGRPLVGDRVHHRSRVLIVTAEDNMEEMRRRLKAARMHHGIDLIGAGWLAVVCLTGSTVSLTKMSETGDVVETGGADRIAETIRRHRSDVVILDPFVKLSGAPENSNDGIDVVMRALVRIADKCNCACLVLHHNRKGQATPGDADLARGAGAIVAAARVSLTVTGMTTDEASKMGVLDDDRVRLIRIDDAKANLAPRASKARWYRLASIPIGEPDARLPSRR
ncbi:MAG: AAA family ATPase [Acidobacteria bacterium]|nr:AAA family ATPase [Acidobacteriota bacterium]